MTRIASASILLAASLLAASCMKDNDPGFIGCIVGTSASCACTNGTNGAQICQPGNFYGPCVCEGGDAWAPDAQGFDVVTPDTVGPEGVWVDLPNLEDGGCVGPLCSGDASDKEVTVPIDTAPGAPSISVPSLLDFGVVPFGQQKSLDLQVTNTGSAELLVTSFALTGETFTLITEEGPFQGSPTTQQGVTFDTPVSVPAGQSYSFKVEFSPEYPDPAYGELRLLSNDPDPVKATQGAIVGLQGNVGGACIAVDPKKVEFGGKLIGSMATVELQILSCGDEPLQIDGLRLLTDTEVPDVTVSSDFFLDLDGLPGVAPGTEALYDGDPPVMLGVNESAFVTVHFIPDEINPKDANGVPIPDLGFIQISSNTFVEDLTIEVQGFGVEVECPTAIINVAEGDEVIPQTKLHLSGSQSYAPTGPIAQYQWTVTQPPGSMSVFLPNSSWEHPTFEANIAGTYEFRLRVWDQNMQQSCVDAEYVVIVTPDEAIHIELIWDTPDDPDQTDEGPEAGADLDLHFLHPFATGLDVDEDGVPDGYFDNPFDCFWFNPAPDWGSHDPLVDDDPGLDRDDTDGAGPENINLNIPEDGLTYRVGVHYWNDHGWGTSFTTVRVYIMSVLTWETEPVALVNHDLWNVLTVDWPGGNVTPIMAPDGSYDIVPNYEHPLFLGE